MISVCAVIPVFNGESVIQRAVDSVLRQSEPPNEVIVVDDGSTDATATRLEAYGGSIRLIRQERSGVSSARNKGIEASRSEWVAFLDSDDSWNVDKLGLQRKAVMASQGIGCVHTRYIIENAEFRELSPIPPSSGDMRLADLLIKNRIGTSTVMAHRQLLCELGGFDESLMITQDWDLWLRMAQRGIRFAYVPIPLASYRLSENSLVTDLNRVESESLRVLECFLLNPDPDSPLKGSRGRIMGQSYVRFARQRISVGDRTAAWNWLSRGFNTWPQSIFTEDAFAALFGVLLGRRAYKILRSQRRILLERQIRLATTKGQTTIQ